MENTVDLLLLRLGIKKEQKAGVVVAVLSFFAIVLSLALYRDDNALVPQVIRSVLRLLMYGLSVVGAFALVVKRPDFSWLVVLPIFYWIVFHVHVYQSAHISADILGTTVSILYMGASKADKKKVFEIYRLFIVLTAVLGIIVYLSNVLHLPLPHRTVGYYGSEVSAAKYIDYYFGYLYKRTFRLQLCGLFNEPGLFGTVLALILCAEKIDLRKFENLILLTAGVLTFSLAFWAILVIYVLCLNLKNAPKLAVIVAVLVKLLQYLANLKTGNKNIDRVLNRLDFSKGKFSGDNRTTLVFDALFKNWQRKGNIYWGLGNGFTEFYFVKGTSSYKTYLMSFGYIGFTIIVGVLLLAALSYSNKNKRATAYILAFFASIYQRPNVFVLTFYVLLFGGILYILDKEGELKR